MAHDTNELVSKYRASGLPQEEFSAKFKVPLSTLQYHLHKHKKSSESTTPRFLSFPATPERPHCMTTIAIIRGSFTPEQISALISGGMQR